MLNQTCFSVFQVHMCWYLSPVLILTVCVIICYQVYKVFFADSRSLDGISRYRSVNFLVFVTFFVVVFNLSEGLLPVCILLTLLFTYVFVSSSLQYVYSCILPVLTRLIVQLSINEMPTPDSCLRFMVSRVKMICSRFTAQ